MSTNNTTSKTPIQREYRSRQDMGPFSLNNVLFDLYEAGSAHLSDAQLEYMTDAAEAAMLQASNLSSINNKLGNVLMVDEKLAAEFCEGHSLSLYLNQLAYQLDEISSLIEMAGFAEFQLKKRQKPGAVDG